MSATEIDAYLEGLEEPKRSTLTALRQTILSIIPGLGTALVWVPAVFYLIAIDHFGSAVGLAIWCMAVVGTADNVLRPVLVGRDAKMPDLLILLSTLGGLVLFGAVGIVIGPIIAALFVTVWEIYGTTFSDILPHRHEVQVEAEEVEA